MLKRLSIFFIISIFLISCNYKKEILPKKQPLFWTYSDSLNAKDWEPARVPGSFHVSLVNSLFLVQNFYFDHYTDKIKWLSQKNWFFKTKLDIDKQTYRQKQIWLLLPGLDTYSKIYINGTPIAQTDDFFDQYKYDIKKYIHPGRNQIIVQFFPPISKAHSLFKALKIKGTYSPLSILRKPYFQLHHQLGSSYITMGFAKTPQILLWEKAFIQAAYYSFYKISKKQALVSAHLIIFSSRSQKAYIQIKSQYDVHIYQKVKLHPGKNELTFNFKISDPKLWYPYTSDNLQPELYKFTSTILIRGVKYSEKNTYTGIRKIKFYSLGNRLMLKINDSLIFLKAAQIYPLRVNIADENDLYQRLIKLIKEAGFNAIITSDKGWYRNQNFYNICDEQGILVIQTLPIAYKILPPTDTLINLILSETKQNIQRLFNHPSIIAWNANYNPHAIHFPSQEVKKFSDNFFLQVLPALIHSIDSSRYYLTNLNFKNTLSINNDFVSMPNNILLRKMFYIQNETLKIDSTLTYFTKPSTQLYFQLKKQVSLFYPFDSLTNAYYFSQVIQKQKFEKYINSLPPFYQNHLIVNWFNDITPAISPSFIDYSLQPKAKYYFIKDYLSNFRILTKNNGNNVEVTLISAFDTAHVLAYYKLYDLYGHLLWQKVENEALVNHMVSQVFDLGVYLKLFSRDSTLMKIEVYNNFELVAEKYHYFINQAKIKLLDPDLSVSYYPVDEGYALEITANKYLAKNVHVISTLQNAIIDDNYFDILPGESKVVVVELPMQVENFEPFVKVYSQYDYLTGRNNSLTYKVKIQPKDFKQVNQ